MTFSLKRADGYQPPKSPLQAVGDTLYENTQRQLNTAIKERQLENVELNQKDIALRLQQRERQIDKEIKLEEDDKFATKEFERLEQEHPNHGEITNGGGEYEWKDTSEYILNLANQIKTNTSYTPGQRSALLRRLAAGAQEYAVLNEQHNINRDNQVSRNWGRVAQHLTFDSEDVKEIFAEDGTFEKLESGFAPGGMKSPPSELTEVFQPHPTPRQDAFNQYPHIRNMMMKAYRHSPNEFAAAARDTDPTSRGKRLRALYDEYKADEKAKAQSLQEAHSEAYRQMLIEKAKNDVNSSSGEGADKIRTRGFTNGERKAAIANYGENGYFQNELGDFTRWQSGDKYNFATVQLDGQSPFAAYETDGANFYLNIQEVDLSNIKPLNKADSSEIAKSYADSGASVLIAGMAMQNASGFWDDNITPEMAQAKADGIIESLPDEISDEDKALITEQVKAIIGGFITKEGDINTQLLREGANNFSTFATIAEAHSLKGGSGGAIGTGLTKFLQDNEKTNKLDAYDTIENIFTNFFAADDTEDAFLNKLNAILIDRRKIVGAHATAIRQARSEFQRAVTSNTPNIEFQIQQLRSLANSGGIELPDREALFDGLFQSYTGKRVKRPKTKDTGDGGDSTAPQTTVVGGTAAQPTGAAGQTDDSSFENQGEVAKKSFMDEYKRLNPDADTNDLDGAVQSVLDSDGFKKHLKTLKVTDTAGFSQDDLLIIAGAYLGAKAKNK